MPIASRLFCAACQEETLHTTKGCAHCAQEPKTKKAPSWVNAPIGEYKGAAFGVSAAQYRRALRRAGQSAVRRTGRRGRPPSIGLTASERNAATLIAKGLTQRTAAAQLGIGPTAISSVLQRACVRVGAENTAELIRYMRNEGVQAP